jgi:hypothetical protein
MKGLIAIVVCLLAFAWFCYYSCAKEAQVLSKVCGLEITASDVFWAGDNLKCFNSTTLK